MSKDEKDPSLEYQLIQIASALKEGNQIKQEMLQLMQSQVWQLELLQTNIRDLRDPLFQTNVRLQQIRESHEVRSENILLIHQDLSKLVDRLTATDKTSPKTQSD
ncbi:MAG: hypothetical protein AAFO04_30320 [Cyanobacteria bacterium J06592_8]